MPHSIDFCSGIVSFALRILTFLPVAYLVSEELVLRKHIKTVRWQEFGLQVRTSTAAACLDFAGAQALATKCIYSAAVSQRQERALVLYHVSC